MKYINQLPTAIMLIVLVIGCYLMVKTDEGTDIGQINLNNNKLMNAVNALSKADAAMDSAIMNIRAGEPFETRPIDFYETSLLTQYMLLKDLIAEPEFEHENYYLPIATNIDESIRKKVELLSEFMLAQEESTQEVIKAKQINKELAEVVLFTQSQKVIDQTSNPLSSTANQLDENEMSILMEKLISSLDAWSILDKPGKQKNSEFILSNVHKLTNLIGFVDPGYNSLVTEFIRSLHNALDRQKDADVLLDNYMQIKLLDLYSIQRSVMDLERSLYTSEIENNRVDPFTLLFFVIIMSSLILVFQIQTNAKLLREKKLLRELHGKLIRQARHAIRATALQTQAISDIYKEYGSLKILLTRCMKFQRNKFFEKKEDEFIQQKLVEDYKAVFAKNTDTEMKSALLQMTKQLDDFEDYLHHSRVKPVKNTFSLKLCFKKYVFTRLNLNRIQIKKILHKINAAKSINIAKQRTPKSFG